MLEITPDDIDRWKDLRDPNREAKKKSFENTIDQYIADMSEPEERTAPNDEYKQ